MQRLGLGGNSIIQSSTARPSRVISIPQPPIPPLPAPTFFNTTTANSFQLTSSVLPEYNGTYVKGFAPEQGVDLYYIREPQQDLFFWLPGGNVWVLEVIGNDLIRPADAVGDSTSFNFPTNGWIQNTAGTPSAEFSFTVLN